MRQEAHKYAYERHIGIDVPSREPWRCFRRGVTKTLFVALALPLLACEGDLKPELTQPQLNTPQRPAPTPTAASSVPPMLRPPTEPDRCLVQRGYVAPVVMRRLTRREYENSTRELIGVDIDELITGFPPEEEVNGFDNQSKSLQVSALHVEQYLDASERLAELTVDRFDELSACTPMERESLAETEPCARNFIERFGARAWRRPLTPTEVDRLSALYREGFNDTLTDLEGADAELLGPLDPMREGLTLTLSALFQSPYFLYRVEFGAAQVDEYSAAMNELEDLEREPGEVRELTSYELASRLSYLLWRSMPDEELFAVAASGELSDPAELERQAERMLLDPQAAEGLWSFFEQWLAIDEVDSIDKDAEVFPTYTRELNALLATEARLFIEDVVFERRDMRRLFDSASSFVNYPLALHYAAGGEGAEVPASAWESALEWAFNADETLNARQRSARAAELPRGDTFTRVALNPERRSGLLTRGAVLALTTKPNMGDPVHRGIYVRERLLCTPLPPPPPDIVVVAPDPDPNLTTREQFAIHSSEPACAGCHKLVDPLGFGLERFDPVGRFRELENGKPLDDSGEVVSTLDLDGPFEGSAALARKLAQSEQVQRCVVLNVLRYAHGRSETRGELCDVDELYQRYTRSDYDLLALLRAVISSPNFRYLHLDPPSAEAESASGESP